MQYGISILLSGISLGGQYALIAIGYTMVYGILRLINFAHGDVFMVAGLMMVYLSASLPLAAAIPLMIILTVLLGFIIERAAYKPLRTAPRMSVMISAIGVSYLLQNLATYVTGGLPQMYPALPGLSNQLTIAGVSTKYVTVVTPVLVVLLVAALTQLINHTRIGMAMRAVSRDFETAQLMGIRINSVISVTFIIGPLLAAIGSLLYFTNYQSIVPLSGSLPGLRAFVAAVFGGIGSIPGAVVGAFLIGICESVIKGSDWSVFSDAFTFAILIVVLCVKPTGLFGEKVTDKVYGGIDCAERKEKQTGHGDRPALRAGAAGAGRPAGKHHEAHGDAVHRPEKGRGLRAGGGVHEPAQRLHRPVFSGTGGLHAAGRLHLRHSHHSYGGPGSGVLSL